MLSLPWTSARLSAGKKGTTSVSRYDRDQAEIERRDDDKRKAKGSKREREHI
jgi:hypothetical protein